MSVDYSIANIVIVVWDVEDVEIAIVDWIEVGMLQKNQMTGILLWHLGAGLYYDATGD
jgi:hypothetical protein